MKKLMLSVVGFWAFVGLGFMASMAIADQTDKISVPVAFGRGLNTGGAVNHAILPDKINVKKGGVVHFQVAGFHQVVVFEPGTKLRDIFPDNGRVIDVAGGIPANVFYLGTPPSPLGVASPLSNARNRVESVAFLDPGTYLVICNVTGHFVNDDMFAFVKVK